MRVRPKLAVLAVSLLVGGVASPHAAHAAPPKKAPEAAPKKKDDPAAIAHKAFLETIKDGTAKYVAKDIAGAIDTFQKATETEPRNPVGYYYLAEAHLGNVDLAQAESALLHASQVSDEGTPGLKAKIFFLIADLRERQHRWDDAKASWEQYGQLAAKFVDATSFPQVAKERIAAIDLMVNQDKAYEIVRKRIAEEKAKAAATPAAH
jgi:tetratricopeptide (TPR) repeat protein